MTPDNPRAASQPDHDPDVAWDVRIPVRDGLELSANLWRPLPNAGAPDERFPAILEMIPYGKDTWRRNWDTAFGEWLAARGFALCRLDVRGTGSSPGVALDEYTEAETLDGFDAVEWLAAQPWCNGNVGMWGISYGGFTAIQVAKLRPPHLRAIVPMYATDDRYRDDVHVHGGCLTASEKSQYAVSQLGMNAMPPRPSFRGAGWRDEWRERLEQTPPWLFAWVREQLDGPYWRRGSLAPDYEAIECAVFQIAGWTDAYVDPAFRIQERCVNAARRTLVGNWVHSFPDDAYPGPNLDWMHEFVRFFDRYLNDVDNGWEHEPALTWFEREWAAARAVPEGVAGAMADRGRLPGAGQRRDGVDPGRRDARGRGVRRRHRPGPALGDGRDGRGPVMGRGLATERPRARPSPGRGARPDLHERPARRPDRRHRQPRGRPPPVDDDAGGDLRRPPVRGLAVGRLGAGRDRCAEPHPSAVGRHAGADAPRPGGRTRGGAHRATVDRLSVHARVTPPAHGAHELLAGALAIAAARRARRPPRLGDAVAAGAAGRAGRGTVRDGDGDGVRRPMRSCRPSATSAATSPTSPCGGSRRTSSRGRWR